MTEPTHTILVVDDNQDNRDLIRRRLERAGYRVLLAEEGMQALERVQSEAIDLVILDIMMPGISGIDVLRILRQSHSAADLPIIMATAKDQSEDVVEALDYGANDYVTKPLDFPVILARVQAQLRNRTASEAAGDRDLGRLEPGEILAGKYRLEEELGSGNFGKVFRALHLGFQQPVAIKVLHTSVDDSKESLSRFQQEGVSAFRIQHPNAVSVLDFHTVASGQAFLVMELLEGRPLDYEIEQEGPLSVERCGEILPPICEVLAEAHGLGIIHRDIKPANIFLQATRRGEVVKVLDFGIAKLVGDAAMGKNLTLDETVLGTPSYMAPERLSGEDYDGRADVYALGIVLYQMLAGGAQPFPVEGKEAIVVAMMHLRQDPVPLSHHRPDISPEVEAVVMATMAKNPGDRPDVTDLARRFQEAITAGPRSEVAGAGDPSSEAPGPAAVEDDRGRRSAFEFGDLLEPPPGAPAVAEPVPVFAPRHLAEPWRFEPPWPFEPEPGEPESGEPESGEPELGEPE